VPTNEKLDPILGHPGDSQFHFLKRKYLDLINRRGPYLVITKREDEESTSTASADNNKFRVGQIISPASSRFVPFKLKLHFYYYVVLCSAT